VIHRLLTLSLLLCRLCHAQAMDDSKPASSNVPGAAWPRVHADLRVSFRLTAPNAQKVQLQPGGGDNGLGKGPIDMVRDDKGVWTVTTEPAQPDELLRAQRVEDLALKRPAAAARVAVRVDDRTFGRHHRPPSVDLERAALGDEGGPDPLDSEVRENPAGDEPVVGVHLLAAPAVEVHVQPGEPPAGADEKQRSHVAHPKVVVGDRHDLDPLSAGTARFVAGGRVVVDLPAHTDEPGVWAASQRAAFRRLRGARNSRGELLRELVSREPASIPAGQNPLEFVSAYVNWYVCNGAVLIPAFGARRADGAARALVEELFPGRVVEQLRIDAIAAGGGGIHCCTQQQPAL